MRKHIGKALQTRSAAIKTALERYNAAARELNPPREELNLSTVLEYSFLADFDLLRETRQDIREHLWSTPTGRIAIDQYFKLLRAPEEILRCNVEIRRVVTQLRDEERYLRYHEERVRAEGNSILAHHIGLHRNIRGRFSAEHHHRLSLIAELEGFSGTLEPGESLYKGPGASGSWRASAVDIPSAASTFAAAEGYAPSSEEIELQGEQEDDDEEAQEQEDEADVLAVIMDRATIADP